MEGNEEVEQDPRHHMKPTKEDGVRAEAGDGVGNEDAEATRRVADEATARDEAWQLVRAAVDAALAEADAEEEAGVDRSILLMFKASGSARLGPRISSAVAAVMPSSDHPIH